MENTKKNAQKAINEEIIEFIEEFNNIQGDYEWITTKRLNNCTAWYTMSDRFIVLKSYNTNVAVIDTETKIAYDVLRYVYGYTSTSCQHIRKFFDLFGYNYYGLRDNNKKIMRYYPV